MPGEEVFVEHFNIYLLLLHTQKKKVSEANVFK